MAVRTIRIFISSPSDVTDERNGAKCVIEELRRRYAGRLDLKAVFWEELPLTADMSFQQGIDLVLSEHGVDVAVFILWSRLGTPVGALIQKTDGAEYRSGTEREWDLMWRARDKSGGERPKIIVYTRRDESSFEERLRGRTPKEKMHLLEQKELVEQFIAEEFRDSHRGTNMRAYHSFDRPATFNHRLRVHLQELLDELVDVHLTTPAWDVEKQGLPYRGLEAFGFEHAPVFFGREDEIVALRQLLREQARRGCAFVLIAGASGSGKSSMARAGVLPAVVAHENDSEVTGWRRVMLSPGENAGDLMLGLARALTAETGLPALINDRDLLAQLAIDLTRDPEMACRRVLRPALETEQRRERLIVLVDQLEELFTDQRITMDARASFLRCLEALACGGFAWVLATVRSDFYAECQSLETLVRMKEGGGQFDLLPPGADALSRLICQPAALAGLRFEQRGDTSLADVIVRDAAAHRELLPLLEYLLQRLCAERTAEDMLTFAAYEKLGGVEGALAQRADTILAELLPSEPVLDALLSSLVTLSGDDQESFVRRRAPRTEVERDASSRALVTRLVSERLLTASAPPSGEATVTVAHEALFRVWSTVSVWLGKNREFLRLRAAVTQSFNRWNDADGDESLLLHHGLPLEEARRLLAIEIGRLTGPVRAYIDRSIAHREAQQARAARRGRIVVAALSVLALLAAVAAVFAYRGYRQSALSFAQAETEKRRAQSETVRAQERTRAAQAANEKNLQTLHEASMADYALAAQLLAEKEKWHEALAHLARALDWEPTNERAARLLYSMLAFQGPANQNWPRHVLAQEGKVTRMEISPDGSRLLAIVEDHGARLWDAVAGRQIPTPYYFDDLFLDAHFSPDGKQIVVVTEDNTARVWDLNTGQPVGPPLLHSHPINGSQFDPSGKQLLTTTDDDRAYWWDVTKGSSRIVPLEQVRSASMSHNGARLLTVTGDDAAIIWDMANGKPVGKPIQDVESAAISPDGARIVAIDKAGAGRVWNTATSKAGQAFLHDKERLTSAIFSPDGEQILSVGNDNTARVWDAGTGEAIGKPLHHQGAVTSAEFSPDGRRVFTASEDRNVRVWDVVSGNPVGGILRHGEAVSSALFSADGTKIFTAPIDSVVLVWDAPTDAPAGEPFRHAGGVTSAEFTPDGASLVTFGNESPGEAWSLATGRPENGPLKEALATGASKFSRDGKRLLEYAPQEMPQALDPVGMSIDAVREERKTAWIWDATTGAFAGKLSHADRVTSIKFSPNGARIVTTSDDKTARIWDVTSKVPMAILRHRETVNYAEFSPDSKRVITSSDDGTARIWDSASGQPIGERFRHQEAVTGAAFGPDGTYAVTICKDKMARVWNTITGKQVGDPLRHEGEITGAEFSADGRLVLTSSTDQTARIWDTMTGKALGQPIRHAGSVRSAHFSPDGTRVVTGADDKTARIWDALTRTPIGEPMHHEGIVVSAVFNPTGTHVVTASADRTARIWDASTGKPTSAPLRHENLVTSAFFNSDGTRIVTASVDETARIWDANTGKLLGSPLQHKNSLESAEFSPGSRWIAVRLGLAPQDYEAAVAASSAALALSNKSSTNTGLTPSGNSRDSTPSTIQSPSAGGEVNEATVWDAATGKQFGQTLRFASAPHSAEISPDGTHVVTVIEGTAQVWDVATGQPVGSPLEYRTSLSDAHFSPDGARIVTRGYGIGPARLWETATGTPINGPLQQQNSVFGTEFSPDSTRLITTSRDNIAQVWDATTAVAVGNPLSHEENLIGAKFSPDGKRILTTGDQTMRLWNSLTGERLGSPMVHPRKVENSEFSPDGSLLVSSDVETMRIWETNTGKLLVDSFPHEYSVSEPHFSRDGSSILAVDGDMARVWPTSRLIQVPLPIPEWLPRWARGQAGLEFSADGEQKEIVPKRRMAILEEIPEGSDTWAQLAKWMARPAVERTFTPESRFTFRQIAERERDSGLQAGVESSLRYDPSVPLAHLFLAEFEKDPARAAFLREFELERLPDDPEIWARASWALIDQAEFKSAIQAARKALVMQPAFPTAQRALATSLKADAQRREAYSAYETLLAGGQATLDDYNTAGYLAAQIGRGDRVREIFRVAEEKFPEAREVFPIKGWSFINLNAPADAITAFKRYESMIEDGEEPGAEAVAGLAVGRWLNGDKQGAAADYQRAIALSSEYADADAIRKMGYVEAEIGPLLKVLAETLKRHPELKPKRQPRGSN